jgi:hypothetical protein
VNPVRAAGPSIHWIGKLRRFLQVLAFCLALAALQVALGPDDRPYQPALVYSLAIGTLTWAGIDFGRHAFASSVETGWPAGRWSGVALVGSAIAGAYVVGTLIGDAWFGWSSWDRPGARQRIVGSLLISLGAGVVGAYYFYSRGHAAYLESKMAEASR